jgi:hypothetical protein
MRESYRLHSPVVGYGKGLVNIPAGAVIEFVPPIVELGLIDVLWEGRSVVVFIQEIRVTAMRQTETGVEQSRAKAATGM